MANIKPETAVPASVDLAKENEELRARLAAYERGGGGGERGGPSKEPVTLSLMNNGAPGTATQVVHDVNNEPVSLEPDESRDDVVFGASTAKMLIRRSEMGQGHLVVKGHERKREEKMKPHPTRVELDALELKNHEAGKKQDQDRIKSERPASLGPATGLPPAPVPVESTPVKQ
jgi:hypothetical protein